MAEPSPPRSEDAICTEEECIPDEDENVLRCVTCDRQVHYRCTGLPAYQIQSFKAKKSHSSFHCQNCIKVPKKLLKQLNHAKADTIGAKSVRFNLRNEDLALPVESTDEIDRLNREVDGLKALVLTHEEREKRSEEEIKKLRTELAKLRQKLNTDPGLHVIEDAEQRFVKKLESFENSIKSVITKECEKVEERIETKIGKTYANAVQGDVTGPPCATSTDKLKSAIKSARKEELAEEEDRKRRSKNILVHGVKELDRNMRMDDKRWADELVAILHVNVNIQRVSRIGKALNDKARPLLIVLKDEEEKFKLMGNLAALKGVARYQGVSISEDLTPDERDAFKALSNEAKDRNKNEESNIHVWRVRGSSKNGFYIKKFTIDRAPNRE